MSNSDYNLESSTVETQTEELPKKTKMVINESLFKPRKEKSYKIETGFNNVKAFIPFIFTLSPALIDFGEFSPTDPVSRTGNLKISLGSVNGYSVFAYENNELTSGKNSVIPDTTCDDGTCNEESSSVWSNILTYGFGYRCENLIDTDCDNGFLIPDSYKHFANNSKSELPKTIMTGKKVQNYKEAKVTYKVNISGTQPKGIYQTSILYIAIPTF